MGRRRVRWWPWRPARRTARRSGGCRSTSPTLVTELVVSDGAHVRAGRQRRRRRDDELDTRRWSPETARAHVIDLAAPRRSRRWPACSRWPRRACRTTRARCTWPRAVGVPVAALFGPTREHETAPLPRARRARRRADSPGVVPPLYAARVSDRSPVHEGAVARARVAAVRESMA